MFTKYSKYYIESSVDEAGIGFFIRISFCCRSYFTRNLSHPIIKDSNNYRLKKEKSKEKLLNQKFLYG